MVYLVLKIIPPAAGREKGVNSVFSHEEIQSLNMLEMSVYNYVSKNREKVIYMKIRELAAQAHVSTTTVLHMCKKFGCEGYTEFKLLLKQELLKDKKDSAAVEIPDEYTQFQQYSFEAGFGKTDVTCAVNEDMTKFYISFTAFDEEQVLEGILEDGILTVTYDKTGFMTGEAQVIYNAADPNNWQQIG